MAFTDPFIRRPVLATVVSRLIILLGFQAFSKLTIRQYPQMENALITVTTAYPGANAETIQGYITQPLQQSLASADGIDYMTSVSRQNVSIISIYARIGANSDRLFTELLAKANEVKNQLPQDAEDPVLSKEAADSTALMYISFYSQELSNPQITDYLSRVIQPKLATLPGMAEAEILGNQVFAMRLLLDPVKMGAYGVTASDVNEAVRKYNFLAAAGEVKGEYVVTSINAETDLKSAEAFAAIPLKTVGDSRVLIRDVARVEMGAESYDAISSFDGTPSVYIAIKGTPGANPLDVIKEVRKVMPDLEAQLPPNLKVSIAYDATLFIQASIDEVVKTLGEAVLIVIVVVFLFLGAFRSVLIPVITIPLSMIGVMFFMQLMGYSINLLTLLALVLAIGLVVDAAIVVVENIQRRIDEGEPPIVAAQRGARQVFFAGVATTIVLISVFAPLMFLPGFIGRLFVELAVSVAAAVGFSALLALSLSPMLASKLLRPAQGEGWVARRVDSAMSRLKSSYHASLESMLGRRAVSIGASGLVVILAVAAFGIFSVLPRELTPEEDRRRAQVSFSCPEGAGFDYTLAASRQIEQVLMKYLNDGTLERYVFAMPRFGNNSFNSGGGNTILSDKTEVTAPELAARLNRELASVTAVRAIVSPEGGLQRGGPGGGGGGGTSMQLIATGTDYPEIARWIQPILAAANDNPGLARPRLDYEPTSPRVIVNIDREKAAALGVPAQTIGRALETQFGSRRVESYIKNGQEYDVLLQTDRENRQTEQDLAKLYVRTASGESVPLSSVVTTEVRGDTPDRPRAGRLRSISLSVQLHPGYSMGEAIQFFRDEAAKQPGAVTVKWGGGARDYLEASGSVGLAFAMALLLVFLVLAAQFESWIHPAVIMLTVPVAAVGGLFGLLLVDSSINTYSQIGLIILIGIAAKNGILIVEFANQLRDEGLSIREAVIESASLRLRPIIMTSISAAAGAIPLIVWGGAGGEARKTIGVTIFFGAIFATLVTLFIVPVFYNLLARFTKSPMATARRIEAFEEAEKARVANAAE